MVNAIDASSPMAPSSPLHGGATESLAGDDVASIAGSVSGPGMGLTNPTAPSGGKSSKRPAANGDAKEAAKITTPRVDVDGPLMRMHELLQDRWSRYQQVVTDFLLGRLNRDEFETQLKGMREIKGFIRLHNEIIMALLSNAYRDQAPSAGAQSVGWSKKRRVVLDAGDPAAKRLKAEVMGLSKRERARIKKAAKQDAQASAQQQARPRPNSMIETRFAKLPRVPVSAHKINSAQYHNDIVKGFHVPLATETFLLPEAASLKDRIVAGALENGLLGGVGQQVSDLLISGLEMHLKNILTHVISRTKRAFGIDSPTATSTTAAAAAQTSSPSRAGATDTAAADGDASTHNATAGAEANERESEAEEAGAQAVKPSGKMPQLTVSRSTRHTRSTAAAAASTAGDGAGTGAGAGSVAPNGTHASIGGQETPTTGGLSTPSLSTSRPGPASGIAGIGPGGSNGGVDGAGVDPMHAISDRPGIIAPAALDRAVTLAPHLLADALHSVNRMRALLLDDASARYERWPAANEPAASTGTDTAVAVGHDAESSGGMQNHGDKSANAKGTDGQAGGAVVIKSEDKGDDLRSSSSAKHGASSSSASASASATTAAAAAGAAAAEAKEVKAKTENKAKGDQRVLVARLIDKLLG